MLLRTVEAVRRQSFPAEAFEIVVVEEGDLPQPVENVQYVLLPRLNKGVAFARNEGVRRAAGLIIAFVDDDVLPSVDWLARLVEPFADPAVYAVAGMVRAQPSTLAGEAEEILGIPGGGLPRWAAAGNRVVRTDSVSTANGAFRRQVFETRMFPTEGVAASGGEDFILSHELSREHAVVFTPFAVVHHQPRAKLRAVFRDGYYRRVKGYVYAREILRKSKGGALFGGPLDSYLVRVIIGLAAAGLLQWEGLAGVAVVFYSASLWGARRTYPLVRRKGSFWLYPFVKLAWDLGAARAELDCLRLDEGAVRGRLSRLHSVTSLRRWARGGEVGPARAPCSTRQERAGRTVREEPPVKAGPSVRPQ